MKNLTKNGLPRKQRRAAEREKKKLQKKAEKAAAQRRKRGGKLLVTGLLLLATGLGYFYISHKNQKEAEKQRSSAVFHDILMGEIKSLHLV